MFGTYVFGGNSSSAAVRPTAVAGSFYPADKTELTKMLSGFFAKAESANDDDIAAVIVPHAGYVFSGSVAASAFASINPDYYYEHIFLIGPSHLVYMDGASVDKQYAFYSTPLGNVEVDTALCNKLINEHKCFSFNPAAHGKEHCLEVQLPFLQYHLKKVPPIIPIIVATQSENIIAEIAEALKPYFNNKNLFVISSDFSHYPSYNDALKVDKRTGDAVATGSPQEFVEALKRNEAEDIPNLVTSACGQSAILTLLDITSQQQDIAIHHIQYRNSGDAPIYGEKVRVVGYHAFSFVRKHAEMEFSLSDKEKQTLLLIARKSITNKLNGEALPSYVDSSLTPTLKMACGAFVTLNESGHLRGCIGHFGNERPLYEVVEDMAQAAAFEDPRFTSLRQSELDSVKIEISVLSPLKKIKSSDDFILGKQGIYIKKNGRSGTFLPQVADETHWTKEEFLGHCSQDKAGLGWNGWKDADLYTYEAVVFNEKE